MQENLTLAMAPLQGYADNAYRALHAAVYGGVDVYYTPFIRVENGAPRRQDMDRLRQAASAGQRPMPQIIFRSTEEFAILVNAVKSAGYASIDLNLGCPHPMQTRKGRGAAMIGRVDVMREVAALINADADVRYSVKMRLGLEADDEWRPLMEVLNATRLDHITVHPRVARQMYGGDLHLDVFSDVLAASANPVAYNGDILAPEDIERVAEYYSGLHSIMIGRGLLGRPSLAAEWREGRVWSREERMERLLDFHARLFDVYAATLCGETQILQKIKPFWDYLEPETGHRVAKALRKASSLERYRAAVAAVE